MSTTIPFTKYTCTLVQFQNRFFSTNQVIHTHLHPVQRFPLLFLLLKFGRLLSQLLHIDVFIAGIIMACQGTILAMFCIHQRDSAVIKIYLQALWAKLNEYSSKVWFCALGHKICHIEDCMREQIGLCIRATKSMSNYMKHNQYVE